ncbi:MAG: hypothetical protein EPN91_04895 [Salinibacterium sp.]|nr:MAG: hypothetical protein EPN91_04895 [Salinibacterium sp.]
MDSAGEVGNGRSGLADGVKQPFRLDKVGGVIVDTGVAEYWESMSRGRSYVASTGAAGVAPGTALSTTPPFVLYNPPNSGVIAAVVDIEAMFVSGTLGAGNIMLAGIGGQNISAFGTDLAPQATAVGANTGRQCRALQAPTLSAAPTLIRGLWYTGAFVTNATLYLGDAKKETKGYYGVLPGGALCLQEVGAAGTTPLLMFSMVWIEVPVTFTV